MERLSFYKEMYFKEHETKHKLDDKVPVQIGLITLIASINTYILNSNLSGNYLVVEKYNMLLAGIAVTIALYNLGLSFMNLGRSHSYREIGSMNDFRTYDSQLKASKEANKTEFEEHLEKEFADCATTNKKINIFRTEKIASCKTWLFVAIVISFVNVVIYLLGIFIIPR